MQSPSSNILWQYFPLLIRHCLMRYVLIIHTHALLFSMSLTPLILLIPLKFFVFDFIILFFCYFFPPVLFPTSIRSSPFPLLAPLSLFYSTWSHSISSYLNSSHFSSSYFISFTFVLLSSAILNLYGLGWIPDTAGRNGWDVRTAASENRRYVTPCTYVNWWGGVV